MVRAHLEELQESLAGESFWKALPLIEILYTALCAAASRSLPAELGACVVAACARCLINIWRLVHIGSVLCALETIHRPVSACEIPNVNLWRFSAIETNSVW